MSDRRDASPDSLQGTAPGASTFSVVVPCFNEGPDLGDAISQIRDQCLRVDLPFEIVLVDDGSRDHTWREVLALADRFPEVRGSRLSRNFGKEAALCAGMDLARGAAVITMDADLQHPPELIPEMVRLWRDQGLDVVEAVKQRRGKESFFVRLGAGLFYRSVSGLSGSDLMGATDFKLMDRKVVDAWAGLGERNLFFRGMSAWLGFERGTLPFNVPDRVGGGASRWSFLQLLRLALTGVTSFSSFPLHLTTLIGLCFFLFSVLLGGHTLYMKFSGQAVSGFTTVILLLLIMGSCILLSLGVLGLYVARIYDEVKRRPRYLITEATREKHLGND